MSVPERQILVCMNERDPDASRPSCRNEGAKKLKDELKDLVKDAGLKGRVRVLETSCMDQCEHAAVCVVYPDNVWYSFTKAKDAEDIVQQHLVGGKPVEHLLHDAPENLAHAAARTERRK
ncbi:(2Fe-2S) ferredoxin domain-containing protein [Terriglobus roseus]|uniref:(2Fe-2S) ferredoxin domain-containing protein n=1 Tax=Terriglobus roseus TaxID=392734 RepID=UPI000944D500|nr:(2Fe-2S) ferredoxin domain-containing protein [Terriglobus roseus]